MKDAGFKKKDMNDKVFMDQVIKKIINEDIFIENEEGKKIL